MLFARVAGAVVAFSVVASCAPTNPFDPDTPIDQQAPARLIGKVLVPTRDTDARPILLSLEDGAGQPLRDASGNIALFPTRPSDAPLPDGLADDRARGAAYEISDLPPGSYTVVFSSSINDEPRYFDARSELATLVAGGVALRNLEPVRKNLDDLPGSVVGQVEGAEGGASFFLRLTPRNGDRSLEQIALLSDNGQFEFRNIPSGEYQVQASGDTYAPTSTGFFVVNDEPVFLQQPLRLTTLGRLFALDDFNGEQGLPPFAPFVRESPVHVAIAPLTFVDSSIVPFARVYTDDSRPAQNDGWQPLTGAADALEAAFDLDGADGPRSVFAQLRICFGACECESVDDNGACTDPQFAAPVTSREFELEFILDRTAPRAVSVAVDDALRTAFDGGLAVVSVGCVRFGDAECALAVQNNATPTVQGDLVDDTSRVIGFALTLDDEAEPTSFVSVATLGQLARIAGLAPQIPKADGEHVLRLWAQDAAGNIGLVDARRLVVDVTGIALANPALSVVAGSVRRGNDDLVPGTSVTLDVATSGELPTLWRIRNEGTASARGLVVEQTIPYTGSQVVSVDGGHLASLALLVDAHDTAGNITRTAVPRTLLLSRTSDLSGSVSLENRADASGASITLVNAAGTPLITVSAGATTSVDVGNPDPLVGAFLADGSYTFTGVPVSAAGGAPSEIYTVVASGPAPFLEGRVLVDVRPPGPTFAPAIALLLPRGSLVGRFVLEGREDQLTNTGIQVTLLNALDEEIDGALTFANGTWEIESVPVGSGYRVIGFFDGFIQQEVPGVEVLADVENLVLDDGNGNPTPVVLNELSGDFRLCDVSATLDVACAPVLFTNRAQMQVGGITFDGIAQYRVSTTPFAAGDASPAFVDVVAVGDEFEGPRVTLGPTDGRYVVFLQLRSTSGTDSPVLTSEIVYDTTPPLSVTSTIARGSGALRDNFTSESVGRVTVNASAGGGNDVAPLRDARVLFAATAPNTVPAQTACAHGVSCAVPFDNNNEGTKTAFAFSCDQAGNCSATPVAASVVVDRTAPLQVNGVSFRPSAPFIVENGGQLFTRSAQFDIAVQTGRARTAGGVDVRDLQGNLVSDVFATKFGLNVLVDDGTFRAIPAPAPQANTERIVPGIALPPIDGTYTIFAQLTDAAGNASVVENNPFRVDLVLDTRGPSLTFELDGGAQFTRDADVTLDVNDQSIDRAVLMQVNDDGLFIDGDPSTFEERALPLADNVFTIPAPAAPEGDGLFTVFARFFDRAGNVTERNASIFLDRTPPDALLVDCASCASFNGTEFTNAANKQVVLSTIATDNSGDVESVRTTVRLGALAGLPSEVPFSGNVTVTLSVLNNGVPQSNDGSYTIDVQFVDAAGNVSAAEIVPVTLDTVVPAPTLSINGGAQFTRDENVTLTIGGGASTAPITGIRIANTAATFSGAPQPLVTSIAHQLANGTVDENKLVFLEASDAAGNVATTSASIFLDKRAPSGTVSIAGGAQRTNTRTPQVALTYDVADAVQHAITTADTGFPADCSGVTFTNSAPPATTQVTFAGTGGEPEVRMVSVCTKDRAGNTALAFDTIVLDEDVPAGAVTIAGGAAFTTTRAITATVSAPPDTVQIKSSLSGPNTVTALDCANNTGYGALPSPPSINFTIPGTGAQNPGLYTVQVCLKDGAGNVSRDVNGNPAAVRDEIIFDAAAPTITVVVNGDAAFTTSATVNLTITAADDLSAPLGGIASMRVANTTPTFSGAGEPFSPARTTTVAASTVEESKTVCVEVTDAAGRTASDCDDITLDLLAPTGTVTIARATGNFSTDADANLATTFRSDDTSIASVAFGQAPIDCASVPAASFVALSAATNLVRDVAVAPGEGTRAVTGCFKAQSGLISATTDTVFVDPIDPPLAQPIAPANNSFVATRRPTFSWAAVNNATTYTLRVRRVSDGGAVLTQAGITLLSFTPTTDLPEVPLEWLVQAVKASGRTSAADFTNAPRVTPDATAPSAATALAVAVHTGRSRITTPAPCTATNPCLNDPFPTLSFTPGTDAVDAAVAQVVELTLNGDFTSPIITVTRGNGAAFDVPIALADGQYRWRVKAVDDAGNTTISAAADFIVDRTAPEVPTLFPAQDPVSQTVATAIPIGWSNEGASGAVNYRFELTTEALGFSAPLLAATQTQTVRDVDGILQAGAEVRHLVRVAAIDALGNQSAFAFDNFIHDSVAPCSTSSSVDILGSAANNNFTNSSVATVTISCLGDNPALMQVGCDGDANGKPFVAFANTTTCVLPPGQGARSVQVRISDRAANAHTAPTDTITVDTVAPTTPVLATADTVTNLTTFPVTISSGSIDTNFARHEILDGVTLTSFTPMGSLTQNLTLGPTNRTHDVRVRGVDLAGNVSAEAFVRVTFDSVAPTTPHIFNAETTRFVNADSITISLDVGSDDVNFQTYESASCTGSLSCTPSGFIANPGNGTFTFTLAQNQITRFAIRGRDRAGNLSAASIISVVEDSQNPRPLALQPLPDVTLPGTPRVINGFSRGPFVDVFFDRSETNLAATQIDANFDHFEVRASTNAFLGFVPVCLTATPTCPIPFTTDTGAVIDQTKIPILVGTTIVGFRVPVLPTDDNEIIVRSVDKAGNVSLETSTFTRTIFEQRVTNDAVQEFGTAMFGDKLAYLDVSGALFVREAGSDALWGTADDDVITLDTGISTAGNFFRGPPRRAIAFGPNQIFYAKVSQVLRRSAGADGRYATTADNVGPTVMSSDGAGTIVNEAVAATEPAFSRDRLVWRQFTTGSDTDIIIRQAGANLTFGDGDDTFAVIANDAEHQMFPAISGDTIAFFRCSNAVESQCGSVTPLRLTITHAGNDRLFGTGDDVTNELPQAVNIDAMRPELHTPGALGRASCRNFVAYAADPPTKGLFVITPGPEGVFDATDVPVQIMNIDAANTGSLDGFAITEHLAVTSDGFAPPSVEIATPGPDGCFTRTADNIVFDSGLDGAVFAGAYANMALASVFSPTEDLVLMELGSERKIWPRPEGNGASFFNAEIDRDGIAYGGGVYHFATRTMSLNGSAGNNNQETTLAGDNLTFALASTSTPPVVLSLKRAGTDQVHGTGDDVQITLSTAHPMHQDNNVAVAFGGMMHDMSGTVVVWPGNVTGGVAPIVRTAGVNQIFETLGAPGDDCEDEVNVTPRVGYTNVRVSGKRVAFQECAVATCGNSTQNLFVREVVGDMCTGTETVTLMTTGRMPDIDGERFAFIGANVTVVEAGNDRRLTTTADNITRAFPGANTSVTQMIGISGDRVAWIDNRSGADRVIIGDLGDLSTRVLTRTVTSDTTVTIEGDVLSYAVQTETTFQNDGGLYVLGLEPDLPDLLANPGPTRLRCPADDIFEENDSRATAQPINSGGALNGIVCANDSDRFAIAVATNCTIRARTRFLTAEGNLSLELRDPNDGVVASSVTATNDESIVFSGTVAGTYNVRVFGVGTAENTYDLGVNVSCP